MFDIIIYGLCPWFITPGGLPLTYNANDTQKHSVTKLVISFQWVPENLLDGFISIPSFLNLLHFLLSELLGNKSDRFLLKISGKGHFDGGWMWWQPNR